MTKPTCRNCNSSKHTSIWQTPTAGQKELCNSAQLPRTDGYKNVKEIYEKMGIKVIGESINDELFYDVELPECWKIQPTGHSMWSNLLDKNKKIIAHIFYKASFYDRGAFIDILK